MTTRIPGLRFLIVEDQDFQRMALASLLARLGAGEVLQAPHGRAALKLFKERAGTIDLVISDLDMPDMDGMEFIRHLGESGIPVSVILLSALDRKLLASIEIMTGEYGVRLLGTLEKPVSPGALQGLIAKHGGFNEASTQAASGVALDEIVLGLNNREFQPFFQPKIDLVTGEVRGAEALARWRRSSRILLPDSFIGPLEKAGHIDEFTFKILERSAECCRAWHDAGFAIPVCVNFSLRSLSDVAVSNRITAVAAYHGLHPSQLILEVTESALAGNLGLALETLTRLRLRGFGLAIDDFGTGYSSLQQLSQVPFTELKIDRSFVTDASIHDSRRAILKSSLEMARELGIVSVAEGVESEADWSLLAEIGCDLAQGHFIAKPMDAASFLEWLRDRSFGG